MTNDPLESRPIADGELRTKFSDMLYENIKASEAHKHPVYDADDFMHLIKQNFPQGEVSPSFKRTSKADDSSIPYDISLCAGCNCMTHTMPDGSCGKCHAIKMQPNTDSFNTLYDLVDGWYHEHTRHHLVDVDPDVMANLFKPLMERVAPQREYTEERIMSNQEILTKAIEQAISNGYEPIGDPKTIAEECLTKLGGWHINQIIFDHDFARALWTTGVVPEATEVDENNCELGLYHANGGGYEGYGDYVNLEFTGEPWQYHLQMMVIADDPIAYLGEKL